MRFQNPTIATSFAPNPSHHPLPESLSATTYIECRTSSIVKRHAANRTAYMTSASGRSSSASRYDAGRGGAAIGEPEDDAEDETADGGTSLEGEGSGEMPSADEGVGEGGAGASCATNDGYDMMGPARYRGGYRT